MLNKAVSSQTLNILFNKKKDIPAISNANISFENAETIDEFGKIYGDVTGIPKLIHIEFSGRIRINEEYGFNPNIRVTAYCDKKIILIRNKPNNLIVGNECLLEYTGYIKNLTTVTVYGYNGRNIKIPFKGHLKDQWKHKEATWSSCEDVWDPSTLTEIVDDTYSSSKLRSRELGRSIERIKDLGLPEKEELLGLNSRLRGSSYFTNIKETK